MPLPAARPRWVAAAALGCLLVSPAQAHTGGPDDEGYRFVDSDEPGGPLFDFVDIAATGTPLSLGDDEEIDVALPFLFPFYGDSHDVASVGANGALTLVSGADVWPNNPCPIPVSNPDQPIIAAFWDDLDPDGQPVIFHEALGQAPHRRFVVQWDEVGFYDATDTGTVTFQIVLYEGGAILVNYRWVETGMTHDRGIQASVGIQRDASTGLQYSCLGASLHDSLAVLYEPTPKARVGVVTPDGLWDGDVQTKLEDTGLFHSVDVISTVSGTPALTAFSDHDALLVYSHGPHADPAALGDVLADFVDTDRGLVAAQFSYDSLSNAGLAGRIDGDGYLPYDHGPILSGTPLHLLPVDAGHPILRGVDDLEGGASSYHGTPTLAPGATDVAHWHDGSHLAAVQAPPLLSVVGLNLFPPSEDAQPGGGLWLPTTDGDLLMANALLYAAGQADSDADGWPDLLDGCPEDWDPDQPDLDGDGQGDACDYCVDLDGDGYGDPAFPILACASNAPDCDDTDAAIHPGADESCNNLDDDCDGTTDPEGSLGCTPYYRDDDGDGFGQTADVRCLCAPIAPHDVTQDGDCDDGDAGIHPYATEACNAVDDDCDGAIDEDFDGDGDGVATCAGDCDDTDAAVYPGAPDVCDGVMDNDCDGLGDALELDNDLDSWSDCNGDCDDGDITIHPLADEYCNGVDDDCDGTVDEADAVDAPTWYADTDGDGYGDPGNPLAACVAPTGYLADDTDCDDGDPDTHPGAVEVCDNADNDCDGQIDEGVGDDGDGDGFTACDGDCDDKNPLVFPGAAELCDGLDTNCDNIVPALEVDADGDGALACAECDDSDPLLNLDDLDGDGSTTCDGDCDDTDPSVDAADADGDGFSTCDGDCDDGDASVDPEDADADGYSSCDGDCLDDEATAYPGAEELCDGLDNDCDGDTDDIDLDGDGYTTDTCGGDDCDDGNDQTYPGALEVCDDFRDNDCDGLTDGDDPDCSTGDDDTGDDDTSDDDTGDDDAADDDDGPGGCECEGNHAPGAAPSGAALVLGLVLWTLGRRRGVRR